MRLPNASALLACSLVTVSALNILITNDDGFGTSNIREFYKAVKAYGHEVYIVASTSNQSGKGGTAVYTTESNLTADTEFGIVKAGEPSVGKDPNDSHIWYYNGTPSAVVQVALDYIIPTFTNFTAPDLVLSGPNYGSNTGPYYYTLSGTIGATYTAVERGIPGIAFSAAYDIQTAYFDVNSSTAAHLPDPATIAGQLAANLAQQLIDNAHGRRVLPLGYGINVNLPYITSFTNDSCTNPPFIHTRLTGGAETLAAVFDSNTGLFTGGDVSPTGANTCINGDCSLPGETTVSAGCQSSVSVFTVDYDAPAGSCRQNATQETATVRKWLSPLVQNANSRNLTWFGGLNYTWKGVVSSESSSGGDAGSGGESSGQVVQANGGAAQSSSWALMGAVGLVAACFL